MPSKQTKKRSHKKRHLVRAALATPWAIDEDKLLALQEVLELSITGERFEEDEIRDRLGVSDFAEREENGPRVIDGVAVLPVHGVTSPRMNLMMRISGGASTQLMAKWVQQALNNPKVKAIVLDVDSPGGSAIGNEELSDLIYQARGKKPIKAVITGYGASAAYYVASAADELIASPSSLVGSVGTVIVFTDSSKADAEAGVQITAIHAGKHKGDGYAGLDTQTRETLQERVDDFYEQFVSAIARNRGVEASVVKDTYGQGKAYIASKALQHGMIDRVARLEEIVAELSGGNVRPIDSQTEPPFTTLDAGEEQQMKNAKITAALYSREMVDSMEASEEVCNVALRSFFAATGQKIPETDEKILAGLSGTAIAPTQSTSTEQIPNAQEIAAAERVRIADVQAAGELLEVDAKSIAAAIESGKTIEEVRNDFMTEAAKNKPPIETGTAIKPDGAAYDKFVDAATDAMLETCGLRNQEEPLSQSASELLSGGMMTIARQTLSMQNRRVASQGNEEIAAQFLQLGGRYEVRSADPSFNRAGDYPNLLSALSGKILDSAVDLAGATYSQWTAKLPDLPDFKPKSIVEVGHFDQLDEIGDDEKAPQLKLDEGLAGWLQIDRYAGKFGLTVVMVANDDLDSFGQGLRSMMIAHENTLNRLCLNIVTGNVVLLDGNALFSAAHGNDVTSGATPNADQLTAMRLKHRQQTGVGGKGKVKSPPRILLAPTAHETPVEQLLMPLNRLEMKAPATDATINTFRGTMRHVIEPDLDDYSANKWYTLADPRVRRTIIHAFQRGFGRGGKRTSWFDPDCDTRWVKLEGRFAAAASSFRGIVRNAGA